MMNESDFHLGIHQIIVGKIPLVETLLLYDVKLNKDYFFNVPDVFKSDPWEESQWNEFARLLLQVLDQHNSVLYKNLLVQKLSNLPIKKRIKN